MADFTAAERRSDFTAAERRSSPPDATLALSIDPSGRWMCVCQQGALHLLSVDGSSAVVPLLSSSGETLQARSARFSCTGQLVTAGDDKLVRVWDVASATCVRSWLHHKKIACVELSAGDARVLFADRFGEVYTVAMEESEATPALTLGHLSPVSHLRLASSGASLLTADREGHVRNSCYPHAFVIDGFYLSHTSPLQLMLPLAQAPLLLTAARAGQEVCLWQFHTAALLRHTTAAQLRSELSPMAAAATATSEAAGTATPMDSSAGEDAADEDPPTSLCAACECAEQRMLALVFAGEAR
jgi:hypothetical protein